MKPIFQRARAAGTRRRLMALLSVVAVTIAFENCSSFRALDAAGGALPLENTVLPSAATEPSRGISSESGSSSGATSTSPSSSSSVGSSSAASASPRDGCWITQSRCANGSQPTFLGTFQDTWDGASNSLSRCLSRASEIHGGCGNPEDVPTSAFFYIGGRIQQSRTVGSFCQVTQDRCANGSQPQYVGTFIDTWAGAGLGEESCMQRASQIHSGCGNPDDVPTTAAYFKDGFQTKGATSGSFCRITQVQCANGSQPQYVGTFIDTWAGAGLGEELCMQRASQIHSGCGNPVSIPTEARFYRDGFQLQRGVAGNVCEISQARCQNNVNRSGAFNDDWAQAADNEDACMSRAGDYHAACGNGDDIPTTATFYRDGRFVRRVTVGAGFDPWRDQPYTIGAWYFAMWSKLNDYQAGLSQRYLNRFDPWGGVRDTYDNPALLPQNDGGFTPRRPLIGFYDQMDQRVMDAHILQAAASGLAYFAFYWYWNAGTEEEYAPNLTPLDRYFTSPHKSRIKFMIAPSLIGGPGSVSLRVFKSKYVPLIVDRYIADPDYLRTPDGRPIVNLWNIGLADSDVAAGIDFLRQAVIRKLGVNPVLTGTDEFDTPMPAGLDAYQCFQNRMGPGRAGDDYAAVLANWSSKFAAQERSTADYFPCTISNFDPRPWSMIQPEYHAYFANSTPARFGEHLASVRSYLDSHPRTRRMLTIYAWNEWGEGGEIEPDTRLGYGYLDAVQSAFGLRARNARPEVVNLDVDFGATGVWTNPTQAQIEASFRTLLGRAPTLEESMLWVNLLGTGPSRGQIAQGLRASVERRAKLAANYDDETSRLNARISSMVGFSAPNGTIDFWRMILRGSDPEGGEDQLWRSAIHRSIDPATSPAEGGRSLFSVVNPQ